jgi:hypothetical protein
MNNREDHPTMTMTMTMTPPPTATPPAPRDTPAVHAAILDHLRRFGPATRRELAAACGRDGSTLDHHLGQLRLWGQVKRVSGARPVVLGLAGERVRLETMG